MNERIKELAEQAEQYVNNAMDERANNKDFTFGDIDEMYNTKFAELIIKECIEINKRELAFNAFERLMNKYQDRFGVE